MIEVTEFITNLDQGYSQAFLCRGRDDHLYAVKIAQIGKGSFNSRMGMWADRPRIRAADSSIRVGLRVAFVGGI